MTENQLKYLTLQETQRHNSAMEEDTDIANTESARSNRAREIETTRSNMAKERENIRSNVVKELENERSNIAREVENTRHNKEMETASHAANVIRGFDVGLDFVSDFIPDDFAIIDDIFALV